MVKVKADESPFLIQMLPRSLWLPDPQLPRHQLWQQRITKFGEGLRFLGKLLSSRPRKGLFTEVKEYLVEQGVRLKEGTIVDATIIEAPSSTKNRRGQRDPEMHQVKKGNQYHFGMKLHIGVDAQTGLVRRFATTPANVHDVTQAHRLLHGGELRVWGDAGYVGVQKRPENLELAVDWQVAMRPGQRRKLEPGSLGGADQGIDMGESGTPLPEGQATV